MTKLLPVRCVLFACLLLLRVAPLVGAAQPGEQFKTFAGDGAWSWFTDPRAIERHGKIYVGWVMADGSVQVGAMDPKIGETRTVTLTEKF